MDIRERKTAVAKLALKHVQAAVEEIPTQCQNSLYKMMEDQVQAATMYSPGS